ncbi:MAG: [FeFe] hydrogenase H-cluster radical SAM maturase HydG [Clostridia bacterium]|nr:[FeFe] hydrogenase H-cluster radical SAM maturase HydG [Clostridia bacterium]
MFIDREEIEGYLSKALGASQDEALAILKKADRMEGLTPWEVAVLLQNSDPEVQKEIFHVAGEIKKRVYGNRIVVFAPLYISNYCVNNCIYCGYHRTSGITRKKLSMDEIRREVQILEAMGHKRLALEAGEDPVNCTIDYILEAIKTIYDTPSAKGNIRRINVNIAATTVENYKKLKEAGIGTYILFQETYHQPTYERMHPKCLKSSFEYHLTAFDRAMEAGIDDVGAGALFGLADPKFEVLGLMIHNQYLEKKFGVGFHTLSVPRLKKAEGMDLSQFPDLVPDELFKKLVAILRLAVPYTGIILSTRESAKMRKELIHYGVSQVSAGSQTGVGGYQQHEEGKSTAQFQTSDERSPLEVLNDLMKDGLIPSYCTACYRQGRTGDRFMQLAKSGQIHHVCTPNALMTLMEYASDFGDTAFKQAVKGMIDKELEKIERPDIKAITQKRLEQIEAGERDLFL